jgi:hypothetical protein
MESSKGASLVAFCVSKGEIQGMIATLQEIPIVRGSAEYVLPGTADACYYSDLLSILL